MNLYELASRVIEALEAESIDYITRWTEIHQTSGHLQAMLAEIEPLL